MGRLGDWVIGDLSFIFFNLYLYSPFYKQILAYK